MTSLSSVHFRSPTLSSMGQTSAPCSLLPFVESSDKAATGAECCRTLILHYIRHRNGCPCVLSYLPRAACRRPRWHRQPASAPGVVRRPEPRATSELPHCALRSLVPSAECCCGAAAVQLLLLCGDREPSSAGAGRVRPIWLRHSTVACRT